MTLSQIRYRNNVMTQKFSPRERKSEFYVTVHFQSSKLDQLNWKFSKSFTHRVYLYRDIDISRDSEIFPYARSATPTGTSLAMLCTLASRRPARTSSPRSRPGM